MRTLIAAALLATTASAAAAECTQADLTGAWIMNGNHSSAWSECVIKIEADGRYAGRCVGTEHPPGGDQVTGRLTLKRSCRLAGNLKGPGFTQRLKGIMVQDPIEIQTGNGTLRYGDPAKNLGILFIMTRRAEIEP